MLTPNQQLIAKSMSEAELARNVESLLDLYKWRWCHFRPAVVTKNGEKTYRTALSGSPGFFDYVAVKQDGSRLVFFELKSEKGKQSKEQEIWHILFLNRPGLKVYLWKPSDWLSGDIEKALK